MKRILSIIIVLICCVTAFAQNVKEVVYLKNGSVIKGTIIEQVPNESLKIQTSDGSVFAYSMSEVQKITKEAAPTRTYSQATDDDDDDDEPEGYRTRGYMGFVEEGTVTDFDAFRGAVHTTHGFQINPHIFVGGGAGILFPYSGDGIAVPVYADFRYTIMNKKVTPYIEAKSGYSFADFEGFYASPSVGVDIAFTEKFGLYVGLAYEFYSAKEEKYSYSYYGYSYSYKKNSDIHAMSLRVGIHF